MKIGYGIRVVTAAAAVIGLISGMPLWGTDKQPAIVVTRLNGTLEVKRPPSQKSIKAFLGSTLEPGDVLFLTGSGQVSCSDLSVHQITPGAPTPLPCGHDVETVYFNGEEVFATRASPGFVPIVLSPRKGKLITTTPLLRWKGLPGDSNYTLSLKGTDLSWSKQVTGVTPVRYPEDAPALKPGASYAFTIFVTIPEDPDTSPDERETPKVDQTPGLAFSIATDLERQQLTTARQLVAQADIDPALRPLMDASVLASYNFHSEAIDALLEVEKNAQSPLLYRLLANSYYSIGLYNEALAATQKAFDLYSSGPNADASGAAWAKLHTGLLYGQIGDTQKAATDLQDAKIRFTALGLDDEADKIQGYLQPSQ
jgi:hypothetical protein